MKQNKLKCMFLKKIVDNCIRMVLNNEIDNILKFNDCNSNEN